MILFLAYFLPLFCSGEFSLRASPNESAVNCPFLLLLSVAEAIDSRKLSFDLAAGWDFSTEEVAAAGRRDKSSVQHLVSRQRRRKKEEGIVRLPSGQLPL